MMYEYDAYVDARKEFPSCAEPLQTIDGEWYLVKSDVLAGTMTFSSSKEAMVNVTTLPVSRVKEILRSTGNNPPPLLDPFAGGGAIPLEAQRLGLEAHAHDLNPVAVMINKAMIEIPPKFAGQAPINPEARLNWMLPVAGLRERSGRRCALLR